MRDRKELIDILECCHEDDCGHCPAYLTDGRQCDGATELSIPVPVFIFDDVLKLLKEQRKNSKRAELTLLSPSEADRRLMSQRLLPSSENMAAG